MYDLLDNSARSSDSDILVATRAVLIELQPILNASLAKQLIAVIALFGLAADLEADLAKDEARELLADLEAADAVGIVADCIHHLFWFVNCCR